MTATSRPTKTLLQKQAIAAMAGIAACFVFLFAFRSVLAPFILGFIVAYLLDPVVDRLEARGMKRSGGTAFVLIGFIVLLVGLGIIAVPLLQDQFNALFDALPTYVERIQDAAKPWADRVRELVPALDAGMLQQKITEQVQTQAPVAAKTVWKGGMAIIDVISFIFIAPIVAFYMLRDWDRMLSAVDKWIPRQHVKTVRKLAKQMDQALSGFVRGQALVCFLLGTFYAVALTLAGLDFGFFIGFAAGVLTFMPYVGTISGFVIGMLVGYVQFSGDVTHMAIIFGIFCVGQFIEGNFLTPRIVGGRVGLHELWIIFALLAGGASMGFTGLLLAVPIAAVIGVLVRFLLDQYMASSYYKSDSAKS